jgi:pilus assembly protein TadC
MEIMQMLKESLLGFVEFLVARSVSVVVLGMLDMQSAVASPAEMAVVSFGGGEVLTERRSGVLCGDIIEASQKSAAPNTAVAMFVHGLYVREDLQTVSATK